MSTKSGARKANYDDESSSRVLKTAKSLVRTDFGGQPDPAEVIRKRFAEHGIQAGPLTCSLVKSMLEEQVASCRKRIFPRIDEVIRRLEGQEAVDAAVEVVP